MTTSELHGILVIAGWSCRIARDQVVLETCYFCGNTRWNLELSAVKGVYHCWACRTGGKLEAILHQLTGQRHHVPVHLEAKKQAGPAQVQEFKAQPAAEVLSAKLYLERRGVTPALMTAYGIVVCLEPGHLLENRIAIPARDYWSGVVVGWVGRSYTGDRPKYLSTLSHRVICGWQRRKTTVVLVEGLLDAIAVHQAGYSAAALLGTGAGDVVEWAARIDPEAAIVIMLDGAAVAQATHVYWQISAVRNNVLRAQLEASADPASIGPAGVQMVVEQLLR